MYSVRISDREIFVKKARTIARPVTVVRTVTRVPVEQGNAVIMHAALQIDYSLEFIDPTNGETKWTFREVMLTDRAGEVMLTDTLWARLQGDPAVVVRVAHRAGSL